MKIGIFTLITGMMRVVLIHLLLALTVPILAQEYTEGELSRRMDIGVELMEGGRYQEAEREFLFVMNNIKALPSNLAYYFGRNSYHLEKFKQSINWLNKYIQLKGTQGRFYAEAVKYLNLAEEQYLQISRKQTAQVQKELEGEDYDCRGLAKMICPVCRGSGVLVKDGPFNKVYKTCPYSAGESFLTCEEYNQFMRGELDPKVRN